MRSRKTGPKLRVLGRSELLLEPIQKRAKADLDFNITFELTDDIDGLQRAVTRPDTFDVYHQWHTVDLIWTARTMQAIDLDRIEAGAEIKAMAMGGWDNSRVIRAVINQLFLQPDGTLGPNPTDRISMLPTVHGVDAFGYLTTIREGLDPGEEESWGWLFDQRWQGRVAIMSDPVLGMIEAALATEATEKIAFDDIGNLSIEEIDLVATHLLQRKKIGHFKGAWANYQEAARFMARGGVAVQSIFLPALIQLRRSRVPVVCAAPVEGCRGWHADLCISALAEDEVLDAAYEYLNWWMSGWAGAVLARQGYYMTLPNRARRHLSAAEWAFWYGGEQAEHELCDPFGNVCVRPGERRDGGSYLERMLRVRLWNTYMDEHTYLVRRWNEFLNG